MRTFCISLLLLGLSASVVVRAQNPPLAPLQPPLTITGGGGGGASTSLGTPLTYTAPGVWKPSADSTTALTFTKADGTTAVLTLDTTNKTLHAVDTGNTPTFTGSNSSYGFGAVSSTAAFVITANTVQKAGFNNSAFWVSSDSMLGFGNATTWNTASVDTALGRNQSGMVEVNNGTLGTFRDILVRDYYVGSVAAGAKTCGSTAPTIQSGTFGTSPAIRSNAGNCGFTVFVGTGGTATSGILVFPSSNAGWAVTCSDVSTNSSTVFITRLIDGGKSAGATTAKIANLTTAGALGAWAASDLLFCTAQTVGG